MTRVEDIEIFAEDLDTERAAALYQEHGCLVVRGLMQPYLADITRDIEQTVRESLELLPQARQDAAGWVTPNGVGSSCFWTMPPSWTWGCARARSSFSEMDGRSRWRLRRFCWSRWERA